jgi:hypothetical protein
MRVFDEFADFVADRADGIDALTCRVVEFPVAVVDAGEVGEGVATAHGDDHGGGFYGLGGEDLRMLVRNVDPDLGHGFDGGGVEGVGGCAACGTDFDGVPGEVKKPRAIWECPAFRRGCRRRPPAVTAPTTR